MRLATKKTVVESLKKAFPRKLFFFISFPRAREWEGGGEGDRDGDRLVGAKENLETA
jgi:hypothetical protein